MEVEHVEYQLSQSLVSHLAAVRTIDFRGGFLISGSVDKSCKIYKRGEGSGHYEQLHEVNICDDFIYAVKVKQDLSGFIIGCKDKKVYVTDIDGNPNGILEGHTNAVCSLALVDDNTVVSGSWDGTARVWDLKEMQCLHVLEGHSHGVAVCCLSNGLIVTGSEDKCLNFWRGGKKVKTLKGVHGQIIRDIAEVPEIGFLTCSNDETVKLWTFEGEQVQEYKGHNSYIYAVKTLSFGTYVSVSEDRSLKIWGSTSCQQTISHPNSIWNVMIDDQGDIITACADGCVRVFTKNPLLIASQMDIEDFQKACMQADLQEEQGMSQEELNKLPSVEKLGQFKGKKDGDIKLFRNGAVGEAYVWKQGAGKWEKIGDVVSGNKRKFYEGDQYFEAGEYDYVFDVDDESGVPKQLPFNEGDNPLVAAEKFLLREKLNKGYIEQITAFIRKSTKGTAASKTSTSSAPQQSKMMQEIPKESQQSAYKYIPLLTYYNFETMNLAGLSKKVGELNEALRAAGSPQALSEKDMKYFENIIAILGNTSFYHSSRLSSFEEEVITNKLLNWPKDSMLPVYDLLRVFMLHPQSENIYKGLDSGLRVITELCGTIQANSNETMSTLALKILANNFNHNSNKYAMGKTSGIIFDTLLVLINKMSENKNLTSSLAALLLNYAVAINERPFTEGNFEQYAAVLAAAMRREKANANNLRYFVAVGTLLLRQAPAFKSILKAKTSDIITSFSSQIQDEDLEKVKAAHLEVVTLFF